MARKRIEENIEGQSEDKIEFPVETIFDLEETDEVIEELEKPIEEEPIEEKPVLKGNSVTVYRNEGKELLLVDSKGNGIRIPTPEQYKNAKKGDIIYI